MNFYNLEKIMDNVGVHNKYLLTSVIAQRARQISEVRGVNEVAERHPGEKSIALALADLEDNNVSVQLQNETIPDGIENELEAEAAAEAASAEKAGGAAGADEAAAAEPAEAASAE